MTALPLLQASAQLAPSLLIEHLEQTPVVILASLDLCLAVAFLALWRSAPDFKVFRVAGILLGLVGLEQAAEYTFGLQATWALRCLPVGFVLETAAEALQLNDRRWLRTIWIVTLFTLIAGWFPSMAVVRELPVLYSQPILAILIVIGFRRQAPSDRIIAAAFTLLFLVRFTLAPTVRRVTGIQNYLSINGWHWTLTGSALTLLGMVTLAVFIRELTLDRDEKLRLATELEAARSVQNVLIPESVMVIPGYRLTSAYRPALEVGGDFFQVMPLLSGHTLIVLGDMSGKGLKAAMAVSFLVGALRTLADASESPAILLAGLNTRLTGRLQGGFVTAVALRLAPDGSCCISSAGHPPPFLNGSELEVPGAFPLGLGIQCTYQEATFQLRDGDHLAIYTDGLLEARSPGGELYSFDRLQTLFATRPTAEQATEAAIAFGQDDDITVLTLSRTPQTA